MNFEGVISLFGDAVKAKLSNPAARGQAEDQLRAPFEKLLAGFAELCQIPSNTVTAVGESALSDR